MSYDPKVFELGWEFILAGKLRRKLRAKRPQNKQVSKTNDDENDDDDDCAGERFRLLDMEKVPLEEQYEMCGLFKQSTFGDIDIKCECKQQAVVFFLPLSSLFLHSLTLR